MGLDAVFFSFFSPFLTPRERRNWKADERARKKAKGQGRVATRTRTRNDQN